MKGLLSVKSVPCIKSIRLEDQSVIVINILVQMVLNGVGLERMGMWGDVRVYFVIKSKIQKIIVL